MSKFLELCEIYKLQKERSISRRRECSELFPPLVEDLLTYLEWPRTHATKISITQIGREVADFLNGAEKDNEGTWHWIFEMALSTQRNMVPEFKFLLDIAVETQIGGGFLVKIPPSEAKFEIKTVGDPQARALNEHVFATLKKWFEGVSDFSSNDKPRRIGFRV